MLSSEIEWFERQFDRLANGREPHRRHHDDRDHESLHEAIMQHLDDLIAAARKLKDERATLTASLATSEAALATTTARADKAEADLADLQKQVADDEAKAAAAETEIQAEVDAEAPVVEPVSVTVSAPVDAGSMSIPVSSEHAVAVSSALGDAITAGSTVSIAGPNIAPGTTVEGVDTAVPGGMPTIAISSPTTGDHSGDGTETLVVTPAA